MFKRKSMKKKSEEEKTFVSYSEVEDVVEGEDNEVKRRKSTDSQQRQPEATEVLKELLTVPVEPEIKFTSELQTDPWVVLAPYTPTILKLLEWTLLFLLGYLGFSYAWLVCFALTYHTLLATKARAGVLTKTASLTTPHEKEVLQACLGRESLPSWAVFPDTDRVEWINLIIKKVWPNIGQVSQQVAKQLVEPKINEILKRISIKGVNLEALSNFKLKELVLGSVPARVGGIRVYEKNTGRDEIVMDLELIYGGDAQVKFSVQAMSCEINQVSFRGTVRLTIKPLLNVIPLVGGFELYFVTMPTLDFNLGGMATFAEVPGISNMIRSVIDNILRQGFVWPNRFNFFFPMDAVQQLKDQTFCMPAPQGVLSVLVTEGKDLMKKDKHLIGGKSDPYVVLSIGEKKVSFVDQYVDSNVNPIWNYEADFPVEEVTGLSLNLEVFDFDTGSDDDFLGRTSLELSNMSSKGLTYQRWVELDDAKHGSVHFKATLLPVLDIDHESENEENKRYVVSVYIDSCSNLQSGRTSPPFSKCEVRVCSGDGFRAPQKKNTANEKLGTFQTKPRGPSENPVFSEGHYFISTNPGCDTLWVKVVDHKTGALLGKVGVKVSYLASLPDLQFTRMQWRLEEANHDESNITLSAKLYQY